MVGQQQIGKFDLLRQLAQSVVNIFHNRRQYSITPPTDGVVLKMHYKYTFWLLMAGFATVYYNWYHRDIIVCVSHFNADTQLRLDYINICLTYPFIKLEDGTKQTMLYYRWVHWVLFLTAFAFYIPHKIAKTKVYSKCTKLMEYLSNGYNQYEVAEGAMVKQCTRHFALNAGIQDKLYYSYLKSNVLALALNVTVFYCLDALLLNKFSTLGYDAYPYERDGQFLSDPLTKAFPPFVQCEIGHTNQLVNKRSEQIGCHLTAQEFYEKLFLALWFWMIFLMITTSAYIIFLSLFLLDFFRFRIIRSVSNYNAEKLDLTIENATQGFTVGDWFLLYKLRTAFFNRGFFKLLQSLGNEDNIKDCRDMARKDLPMLVSHINTSADKHSKGLLIE